MATFGELVQGSINDSIPNGERKGCRFPKPAGGGIISELWLLCAGNGAGNFQAALNDDVAGVIDVVLAQSSVNTAFVNDAGTPVWRKCDVNYSFSGTGDIWLNFWVEPGGGNLTVYFEATGASTNQQYAWFSPPAATFPTFPSPETPIYYQDFKVTCYAVYTTGGVSVAYLAA